MISYSRNFEDVILQRVLADVREGCYVDVGASHPVIDSNTYAFYEKGWRGICVEPLGYYNQLWGEERAEDIFVNAVLGANAGQATFHVYGATPQISTASSAAAAAWQEEGREPEQVVQVPMLTLDSLLEEHLGGRTIHLLSIDVEGMEKEVLSGLDLRKYKPWVVVLEANKPGSPVSNHEGWEPMLLAAGYGMVYRDGLNRFYLSGAHTDLRERFLLPPNVFDQFALAREHELQRRCEELEASLKRLADKLAAKRR